MNKIVIRSWSHSCGDGCCDNYGTDITVNGVDIGCFDDVDGSVLEKVLKALKIDFEIEYINDEV
ncbi:hypothetical protein M5X17_27690 [Paenibacillus alvei]|uniref:hypothetical protein n=1 Tax=Paenibacillus alvei TaxID=44250 RepID=UPI00227F79D9|nr:hypothetical protein [Paenibacillus alvei]MCY9737489.1 hypothetical protein [Paenibacillus alvei]